MKGVFTISLDFELHWGGFEKWPLTAQGHEPGSSHNHKTTSYNTYFLNTRKVIPEMLALFEKLKVHVTWAGVGMLLHENKTKLQANFPVLKPTYVHSELSAYHFIEQSGIGLDEEEDPFHYAHSLVKQILATPSQELGSHTFAHYYCNEEGQTLDQFRADLQSAQKAAAAYGVTLKSLVFPRNQFNDAYLKVCFEEGFRAVRANPVDWFWKIDTRLETSWKRFNRGVDAYFPLGNKTSYSRSTIKVRNGFPVCLPASRLLRPYRPQEFFLNILKINRIKKEMTQAAQRDEIYHLWWHPHNFGNYPDDNMAGLTKIVEHFHLLQSEYGMVSCTMGEMAERVVQGSHLPGS